MTALEVVVRGTARRRYPAERATVGLAAQVEGPDRDSVYRKALGVHEPLGRDLSALSEAGAVTRWSSDQLRVFSFRGTGRRLMYRVSIKLEAEFTDFEQLSAFLDRWAGTEGVEVGYIGWDVTEDNRRRYEADLRAEAVADAVAKAQAFADAVGRGTVRAVRLADPGLLGTADMPFAQARSFAGGQARSGPLELRPDDIEIDAEVEARFAAD